MLLIEYLLKSLKASRKQWSVPHLLSMVGVALGVACLVVSMAVASGFYLTLKNAVTDMMGHILVIKRGLAENPQKDIVDKVKPLVPGWKSATGFLLVEAVLGHQGRLSGVLLQGLDEKTAGKVLALEQRMIQGSLNWEPLQDAAPAFVGKDIAKRFGLKIGDVVRIVVPITESLHAQSLRKKMQKFVVRGVIASGRYDFDSRYILTSLGALQSLIEVGNQVSGYLIKTRDAQEALATSRTLAEKLGPEYWVKNWFEDKENLFRAAESDKMVLFFVLMIIVLVASFNVTTTLYVSVVRRYQEMSILRTLGARRRFVRGLFIGQGMITGFLGAILGILLGLCICYLFVWLQAHLIGIPADVYKIDRIDLNIQWQDFAMILVSSLFMCFLATLEPALRGAKLDPVQGLHYE